MDLSKAKDIMIKSDKKRSSYYNYYSNKKWGDPRSYDLCLNSSVTGLEMCIRDRVYTNLATLKTLDGEQFSSGMGEVIKHGLIKNREYYRWLKANRNQILARDLSVCEEMVLESNRIKRDVVEQDRCV